jgi:hypothetical protein
MIQPFGAKDKLGNRAKQLIINRLVPGKFLASALLAGRSRGFLNKWLQSQTQNRRTNRSPTEESCSGIIPRTPPKPIDSLRFPAGSVCCGFASPVTPLPELVRDLGKFLVRTVMLFVANVVLGFLGHRLWLSRTIILRTDAKYLEK